MKFILDLGNSLQTKHSQLKVHLLVLLHDKDHVIVLKAPERAAAQWYMDAERERGICRYTTCLIIDSRLRIWDQHIHISVCLQGWGRSCSDPRWRCSETRRLAGRRARVHWRPRRCQTWRLVSYTLTTRAGDTDWVINKSPGPAGLPRSDNPLPVLPVYQGRGHGRWMGGSSDP